MLLAAVAASRYLPRRMAYNGSSIQLMAKNRIQYLHTQQGTNQVSRWLGLLLLKVLVTVYALQSLSS